MRLSDIMSSMGLAFYPAIALIIFFGVFVAVVAKAYSKGMKPELDRAASMPLNDDAPSGQSGQENSNVKN